MKNITLIEDEPIIRGSLSRLLTKHGYSVRDFDTIRMAKEANAIDTVDLIISDVRLPGEDGTTLLKTTDTPVLIMTSYASLKSAVQIMKDGAVDYVAKPFDNAEMLKAVKSAISQSSEGASAKAKTRGELKSHIIGQGAAMQRVKAEIEQVAPTDMTVLITGEMGTGKRLIAKAIHELSFRHDKPFKAITCSQIKDGQLYELLFGDDSVLNAIKGGTLFIDEIGRMSLENQSQLLDFIRSAKDSADNRPVRLISASHQDLKMLIQQKLFREDLYFHLNVFSIHLPPLRERMEDFDALVNHLLKRIALNLNRPPARLTPQAMEKIMAHEWVGNVLELENALKQALVQSPSNIIEQDQIRLESPTEAKPASVELADLGEGFEDLSAKDQFFVNFVRRHEGELNETELAKKLGISRKNLWERRQKLGIPRNK